MTVFVWTELSNVSSNYHSDGGLVIVAKSIERAREISPDGCDNRDKEPDMEYPTDPAVEERVFIFPNAGCC